MRGGRVVTLREENRSAKFFFSRRRTHEKQQKPVYGETWIDVEKASVSRALSESDHGMVG